MQSSVKVRILSTKRDFIVILASIILNFNNFYLSRVGGVTDLATGSPILKGVYMYNDKRILCRLFDTCD